MFQRSFFAIAAVMILPTGEVRAAESVSVAIHTTVLPVCRFSASVPLAATQTDSAVAATGTAMTYRCTNGTAPTFTITGATGCAACSELQHTAFVLSPEGGSTGRGFGDGRDLTIVVTGPIAPTPFQIAAIGAVSGVVSVTVSP
jgi:hypothetical protein